MPRSSDSPVGDVAVRRRIGYLPENPYFYDNLTAEELLVYFARLFGYSAAEGRAARARALLDEVGIGAERRFQLRKFSKGMVQRVGIAQALVNDPEVVFLDEPMSGLDPLGRREVRELILRLRDRGCTVFFSSHVLSDAEALCSRVAILAKGRLAASGPLDELTAFRARGWELVVSGLSDDVLTRMRAESLGVTPLGDGRFSLELPLTTAPEQTHPGAGRRRGRNSCRSIRFAARSRTSSSQAGAQHERTRTTTASQAGRRHELDSHRCRRRLQGLHPRSRRRTAWCSSRVLLMACIVPAGAAHRRAGRQDHQGPRTGGRIGDRTVHRGLLRDRPGHEGGRAAEHLQPALEAGHAESVHRREIPRPGVDAGDQPRGDGGRLLRGAGLSRLDDRSACKEAWEAPALDPQMLKAFALIGVELTADHGRCAVLLDVLESVPVGGALVGGLRHRALRRRAEKSRQPRRVASAGQHRPGGVLRHAESRAPRRQVRRRPRRPGQRRARAASPPCPVRSTSACCWSASTLVFSRRDLK